MKSDRRRELFQRIQTLPGLPPEDRAALLGLLAETKRYGLVWEDKPEAAHELLREKIPVFVEDAKRRIEASEEDAPHHVLIEGDNLHALAALQYTHAGKIDVIYIDPPYNTGNKDFRYNDDYVDKEDAYRHSKWLSFMKKRIELGRLLLASDGVLFASVDENEVANIRVLCDGIFGEDNFVGQFNWFKSATPPALSLKVKRKIEYILCYERNRSSRKYQGARKSSSSDDPIVKKQNQMKVLVFPEGSLRSSIKDGWIRAGLYGTSNYPNRLLDDLEFRGGVNLTDARFENRFIWTQEKLQEELRRGTRINVNASSLVISYKKAEYPNEVPPNLIDGEVGVDTTESAGKELTEIIGDGVFPYPKPISLIRYLIGFLGKSSGLVLDFFAGSGTTLHATMALNAEDGGKRQCILVTNNENGICEEVCYERNKRVIQGYRTPKGEDIPGLTANHLHYLKTELVDREPTTKNRRQLVKLAVDLIRLKENAWDRIAGLSTGKEVQAFQGKDFTLFVVVDVDRIPAVVEQVRSLPGKSKVYVLSPDADPFTADFEEVQDRLDLVALPEAIYRSLLPVWRTLPEPGTEAEVADA
jgi:adenine-specific DNA-methyltransferase